MSGSMLFEVVYESIYRYRSTVTVNDNTLRVIPRREPWQRPVRVTIETRPPGTVVRYKDRYGNPVARIRITAPHREVHFRVAATVEILGSYGREPARDPPLPLDPDRLHGEARHFLLPSPLVDPDRLRGLAESIAGSAKTLGEAVERLEAWVYKEIRYERGHTDVNTPAHRVAELGVGVCQDKAHLLIGLLRSIGVPARYVSGALLTEEGETHAWVELYWPGEGWLPVDPTNNILYRITGTHVKYAHGRDYRDVPPINGYYISREPGELAHVRVKPRKID